jgi:hypothetical protein
MPLLVASILGYTLNEATRPERVNSL